MLKHLIRRKNAMRVGKLRYTLKNVLYGKEFFNEIKPIKFFRRKQQNRVCAQGVSRNVHMYTSVALKGEKTEKN